MQWVIPLQDEEGLLFRRKSEMAALVNDGFGRWRVSLADGGVAYLPGPKPDGPWVPLHQAWVLPQLLLRQEDHWVDPAGFRYPWVALEPVDPEEPDPGSVLSLISRGTGSVLYTLEGEQTSSLTAAQKAREVPGLILISRGNYIHPARLRRIQRDLTRHRLVLQDGSSIVVSHKFHFKAAERLGLPHFFHLEPHRPGLWRDNKRDYPYDLITAPGAQLKADFTSARHLLANILWQILRRRLQGIEDHEYPDYRELWYWAVKATLHRAGFLTRAELEWDPDQRGPGTPSFLLLQTLLAQMVGEDRLCTFRDIGFVDKGTEEYRLGNSVLIVCEKDSLSPKVRVLAEQFGVSYIVLGGQPSLIGTEFFSDKIRHLAPLWVIAYVDYDPSGWILARAFIDQLSRYDIDCHGDVQGWLVRPESFTPEELELFALPLEPEGAASAGKIKLWMEECGGINGQEMGITANRLHPVERVAAVLHKLLGEPQP
ncbi:hypothetical protein JST97_20000 [bacterium]|nr:hypothetical protein [bacterium]